jgi:predicted DNA-binding transcriptional regulator YafY
MLRPNEESGQRHSDPRIRISTMNDDPQLVRQWMLLRMMCSRRNGVSIAEMARETGRDKKTIRRDLDFFRTLGVRLIEEVATDCGRKRWKLAKLPAEAEHSLDYLEAYALSACGQFLEPLAGTDLWESAKRALRKIRSSLSDAAINYLDQFGDMIHRTVAASDYTKKAELIDTLMIAIEESRVASVAYQSLKATEPSTRELHPYGFMFNFRALYLVAYAPERGAIRTYKVNRIEDVRKTESPFERPVAFNIKKYLEGSFGVHSGSGEWLDVRVRFDAVVARYVSETCWHPTQRLIPQRDGGLIAEFRLNILEELRSWVLGFGSHATVLEPDELRTSMREELTRALESYQDGPRAAQCDATRVEPKVKPEAKRNRQHTQAN